MRALDYVAGEDLAAALAAIEAPGAAWLAGGTTLLDLAKLDVLRPRRLVDLDPLSATLGGIAVDARGVRLGALLRMREAETHAQLRRDYPVLAQSLALAASVPLRHMATLGGNVLQRTRCPYFRDVGEPACNKRVPGSGCGARGAGNRMQAVLGTSEHCIASYPGDFAQALIALDAEIELQRKDGARRLPFAELHRRPGATPQLETTLAGGELITAFHIAARPWYRRSLYLKVRDRQSYAFALASAAVALDLAADGTVREARIALGGVATVPWRASEAEALLRGRRLDQAAAAAAAAAAFEGAVSHGENRFKPELGRRTLARALLSVAALETGDEH